MTRKNQKKTTQKPAGADVQASLPTQMPLLPLRDVVMFPQMIAPLLVGRPASVAALQSAMTGDRLLFVTAQKSAETQDPTQEDLHDVGVIVKILQLLPLPDGTRKVLLEGVCRAQLMDAEISDAMLDATVKLIEDPAGSDPEMDALRRKVSDQFTEFVQLNRRIPDEVLGSVVSIDNPSILADTIASHLIGKVPTKQLILEAVDIVARLRAVSAMLAEELEILRLEEKIEDEVQSQVQRSQKEAYLQERLKAIRKELGHDDAGIAELEELAEAIEEASMGSEATEAAYKELDRLSKMPSMAPEASVVRSWLETITQLPWRKTTRDKLNLHAVKEQLDKDHYGLHKVKDRILEYLAVLKLTRSLRGPILCLVGPPGVGKTSLGNSIARAMGRRFVRVSLGGMHDEAEIRGHRRTYIGSMPGRIVQSMRRCGTRNPVFLLDEIDKLGSDFRGDPSSALLEALDPEQNHHFSDHYLEVGFDLSKVLFITTANVLHTIPPALRDRLEIIQLPGYLHHEKMAIARNFLLPKQLSQHGINPEQLTISDDGLDHIIHRYTRESGVRHLERELGRLCRKVARQIAEDQEAVRLQGKAAKRRKVAGRKASAAKSAKSRLGSTRVTAANVVQWLLVPPYHEKELADEREVGVTTGLAWTSTGGEILPIEVTLMKGSGKLILTGQLGDVMKESARAALSWVRSRARRLGVRNAVFENNDIHLHVPEGAIPKDGPSAGLAMAAAIASMVSNTPIQRRIAMTGEITLRGKALPIGGLSEKAVAALRAGVHTVLLPTDNQKDIAELPEHVRKELKLVTVSNMEEVLDYVLEKKPRRRSRAGSRSSAYTH